MTITKIVFEYADYQSLMAKIESIERKLDAPMQVQPSPAPTSLLSRLDAAQYLGVGKTLFDKMVKQGQLPYTLVGRTKKYLQADLEAYKQGNRVGRGVAALLPDAKRGRAV